MIPMRLIYPFSRALLFCLEPEVAHAVTFKMLKLADGLGLSFLYRSRAKGQSVNVMGIEFPNPVGLAAGLDKNGAYLDAMEPLGFGFIEVGTVTPRAQPGNPKPRMFRIPKSKAIINRMGFNNQGIDVMVENIRNSQYYKKGGIIGINIGKNFDTPIENAVSDYLICLEKAYPYASYIAVNISSPNTPNLRHLQEGEHFDVLLSALKTRQAELSIKHQRYVPIAIKIAPDLDDEPLSFIAEKLLEYNMDGVIATNTTISRDGLNDPIEETGGLSGVPLKLRSNRILYALAQKLNHQIPIMGVGGINSDSDAVEKINLGAQLVQIYSGFIYEGPALIPECVNRLAKIQNEK